MVAGLEEGQAAEMEGEAPGQPEPKLLRGSPQPAQSTVFPPPSQSTVLPLWLG